jgi:hypothetical protein
MLSDSTAMDIGVMQINPPGARDRAFATLPVRGR